MVYDQFIPPQRRDSVRPLVGSETAYQSLPGPQSIRSRRSSVSSFAESEISIFSDASITSSQTSASSRLSSGWESSTPYDSDDENCSRLYEDVLGSESKETSIPSLQDPAAISKQISGHGFTAVGDLESFEGSGLGSRNFSFPEFKRAEPPAPVRRYSQPVAYSDPAGQRTIQGCQITNPPLSGTQLAQNPRRTVADPSRPKPSLVTQHERRINFVENLVDAATQLVALIWPLAMTEVCTSGQRPGQPVITLRFFIRETLRRSRTSFSTLQVAMYYLALLNVTGQIPSCDRMSSQALHCGRRMFLASLILASKYLQDRNYFTKAWSKISNLAVSEINKNEMALLSALEYKLHIRPCDFQTWTDGISICTAAVQRGNECPWRDVLKLQNLWPVLPASFSNVELSQPSNQASESTSLCKLQRKLRISSAEAMACPKLTTVPEHRLGLGRIGQAVNPTRPAPFHVRSCNTGKAPIQWQGMASYLHGRPCGQSLISEPLRHLSQGLSQVSMRQSNSPEQSLPSNNRTDETQFTLLSPPKTPEPTTHLETISSHNNDRGEHTSFPPTPREPLLSLNTTPESSDGSSMFANYLGPVNGQSPGDFDSSLAKSQLQLPRSTAARFEADTLDNEGLLAEDGAKLEPTERAVNAKSFESLDSKRSSSQGIGSFPPPTGKAFKRSIAAAVRADIVASSPRMDIMADVEPSQINSTVQERTRYLLCSKSRKISPPGDESGKTCRLESKCREALKHKQCHRRKRSAGSFSGEQVLSLRTKKALRA